MAKKSIKNIIKEQIKTTRYITVKGRSDFARKYPKLVLHWNKSKIEFDIDKIFDIISNAKKEELADPNSKISILIDDWNSVKE